MADTIVRSADLWPPPDQKRADTLAIKQRMADMMSADAGLVYWTALVGFLQGKLDKGELEVEVQRSLLTDELMSLHNALVLSILYNTTRSDPPQANARSHTGWNKRKRAPDGTKVEDMDPKRRSFKDAAMQLGRRERARIKAIAVSKEAGKLPPPKPMLPERGPNVLNTALASKIKISSSTLYQDYARCAQAPLCVDAKQLPDAEGLKDRMSLIAYDCGLSGGADKAAASLALIAVEVHLKSILGDILSLVRTDRSTAATVAATAEAARSAEASSVGTKATPQDNSPSKSSMDIDASSSELSERAKSLFAAPVDSPSPAKQLLVAPPLERRTSSSGTIRTLALSSGPVPSLRLRDLKTQGLAPHLTAKDFSALCEISPHAFVQSHPGAVERLLSTQSFSEPSSDESNSGSEDEDGRPRIMVEGANGMASTKRWGKDRARNGLGGSSMSRQGSRTASAGGILLGRNGVSNSPGAKNVHHLRVSMPPPLKFIAPTTASSIDPYSASTAKSTGIPPIPSAGLKNANGNGAQAIKVEASSSPVKDLAAELFPELEGDDEPPKSATAPTHKRSVSLHTDGASGSESEDGGGGGGVGGLRGGGGGGVNGKEKKKKLGWDRVDTFRLLEGVGG